SVALRSFSAARSARTSAATRIADFDAFDFPPATEHRAPHPPISVCQAETEKRVCSVGDDGKRSIWIESSHSDMSASHCESRVAPAWHRAAFVASRFSTGRFLSSRISRCDLFRVRLPVAVVRLPIEIAGRDIKTMRPRVELVDFELLLPDPKPGLRWHDA